MIKTKEDFSIIPDIGDVIGNSVYEYFNNETNKEIIEKLRKNGINFNYIDNSITKNKNFSDKTFVVTGTLNFYSRNEIKELIENLGGKTSDSVSSKTDVVIVGDSPGSKYDKAKKLGIEIWTETELQEKIGG